MVVGEVPESVDLVVVGAGPGGYTAALRAASHGRSVTLVDASGNDGIGGVCLNVGCIPSKALIDIAETVHRVDALADAGVDHSGMRVDLGAWQKHKSRIVDDLKGAVRHELERAGVTVRAGFARMHKADQLVVQDATDVTVRPSFLHFRDAIWATGSRPVSIAELPFDGDRVLDSTGALALDSAPATIAIVGAGYIGVELGTAFAKLGCAVTMVEAAERVLPAMDPAIGRAIERRCAQLGITTLTKAQAVGIDDDALVVRRGDETIRVAAEKVVIAVGRRPNTADIGLDAIGVQVDRAGLVEVGPDRRFAPHLAAIGDITSGPALAHKATAEAIVAADALCGKTRAFDVAAIPAVVFSDPEVAVAGLDPSTARAEGRDVDVVTRPVRASGRAVISGQQIGSTTLVADRADGVVLGAVLVGPHASEQISEAVLAIELGATLEDLSLMVHPHPTVSELIGDAARSRLAAGRSGRSG